MYTSRVKVQIAPSSPNQCFRFHQAHRHTAVLLVDRWWLLEVSWQREAWPWDCCNTELLGGNFHQKAGAWETKYPTAVLNGSSSLTRSNSHCQQRQAGLFPVCMDSPKSFPWQDYLLCNQWHTTKRVSLAFHAWLKSHPRMADRYLFVRPLHGIDLLCRTENDNRINHLVHRETHRKGRHNW